MDPKQTAIEAARQMAAAFPGGLPVMPGPQTSVVAPNTGPGPGIRAVERVAESGEPAPVEIKLTNEFTALTPDEVQVLKEMIFERHRRKRDVFILPDIPPSDADIAKFEECAVKRTPYVEVHSMMKGKFTVKFRTKTKRELDLMFEQLDQDFKDGIVRSEAKYVTLLNNYNLVLQMVEFQGVWQEPVVPPGHELPKEWSLRGAIQRHIINTLPEFDMFLLIGALSQFDQKVRFLSQEALKGNFTIPASES
jgi:hypothetical protein